MGLRDTTRSPRYNRADRSGKLLLSCGMLGRPPGMCASSVFADYLSLSLSLPPARFIFLFQPSFIYHTGSSFFLPSIQPSLSFSLAFLLKSQATLTPPSHSSQSSTRPPYLYPPFQPNLGRSPCRCIYIYTLLPWKIGLSISYIDGNNWISRG